MKKHKGVFMSEHEIHKKYMQILNGNTANFNQHFANTGLITKIQGVFKSE